MRKSKNSNIVYFLLLIICSSVFSISYSVAQDQTVLDSLNNRYQTEENDSLKIKILLRIVGAYGLNNIDTAIHLSKVNEDMAAKIGDTLSLAEIKGTLARFYSIQSQYSTALRYDLEALDLYQKIGNNAGEVITLNDIGEDYFDQDLFKDAYIYYQESLEKAEKGSNRLTVAIATYNIGRVLKSMGQLQKSMSYFNNSLNISRAIGDRTGLAYSLHDLGEILILEKEYDGALDKLNNALLYSDSLFLDELKPEIINKIATVFREKGDIDQSLMYQDRALEIYERLSNKRGIGETYFGKGQNYLLKKEYSRARQYFGKSLSIAQDILDSELIIQNYKYLSQLYESQGDLNLALGFFKKFKNTQDSLFSEKKSEQFSQIQMQYEVAKKDSRIEQLNRKEVKQSAKLKNEELIRNIFVVILALTAVLIANLYRNSIKRKRINDRLLAKQNELKKQGRELKSLLSMKDKFFSIISHDLRSPINGLAGIIGFIQEGHISQDELKEVTKSLKIRLNSTKKMLDSLLDWAMVQMTDINPEYSTVNLVEMVDQNFTYFSEVNEKNIKLNHRLSNDINIWADQNMLDLVVRNLISNSIKFTKQDGEITISSSDDGNNVIVEVKDNGIGMSPDQVNNLFDTKSLYTSKGTANEKGTGLGLKLCKEFIEKMGGKIWVESKEGEGTIFKFTVEKAREVVEGLS